MSDNRDLNEKENDNEKKSVVDRVTDGIIEEIIAGNLKPGDRLPTEMELCGKYNAGRNSVREAVKKLEANGIIYIKRAEGTFIREHYDKKLLDPMLYSIILHKNDWKDFVQLRSVIDIGTLEVIIDRDISTGSINALKRLLLKMEAETLEDSPSVDKLIDLDTKFHEAIARIADNEQLVTITDYITRITIPSRKKTVEKIISENELDNFMKLHNDMLELIINKDRNRIVSTVIDHYRFWN